MSVFYTYWPGAQPRFIQSVLPLVVQKKAALLRQLVNPLWVDQTVFTVPDWDSLSNELLDSWFSKESDECFQGYRIVNWLFSAIG